MKKDRFIGQLEGKVKGQEQVIAGLRNQVALLIEQNRDLLNRLMSRNFEVFSAYSASEEQDYTSEEGELQFTSEDAGELIDAGQE